ncbi:MAG: phosphoribosylamine--glycine ligase, partial [Dethiobacteria bacterium]
MRLLVVGGGGREHALVWKIKQSPLVEKIYCAPGNPGISELAEQVAIDAEDLEELLHFAEEQKIDLTVVGPEAPLVAGITDLFASRGLAVFGPNQKAAQMEGSKVFAKEFLRKYGIPTANFRVFESFDSAYYYLKNTDFPIVIKADGLAAGKGVTVAQNREQAFMALQQIMQEKKFGAAGERVVIEDCLYGEEVSVLVLTDGKDYLLLPDAQDHKAALEGDRGPNTGGMGAYSPAPVFSEELKKNVEEKIIKPVLKGLQNEGITYRGVLYAGLMITDAGPQVLEFNV